MEHGEMVEKLNDFFASLFIVERWHMPTATIFQEESLNN